MPLPLEDLFLVLTNGSSGLGWTVLCVTAQLYPLFRVSLVWLFLHFPYLTAFLCPDLILL